MPRLRLFALALLLAGCPTQPGDDDDSAGGGDVFGPDREASLDGSCAADALYGAFVVEEQAQFGVAGGTLSDGVVPITILEEVEAIGDCALLRRNVPFCDPACSPGFTCDHDGQCVAFPEPQDLGVVGLRGVGEPLEMRPVQPGNRYFGTGLSNPPFTPGKTVLLDALNAPEGELLLEGVGVPRLEVPPGDVVVQEGQPIALSWTAPDVATPARVHLELTIDQHGTSPVRVSCDFPDTGSAEVPAALVNGLFSAGVSGYPNATAARRTVDSAPFLDGCAELRVASSAELSVRVAGHTPCDGPDDCPDDMSCDVATNTCI